MSINWNTYQNDIFDLVENGTGNATVNAVAGSGKTTVVEESIRRIGFGDILYTVFNKHNRESADKKFGSMATVKTIHQLGWAMIAKDLGVRRLDMNDYKYWNLIDDLLAERGIVDKKMIRELKIEYANLCNMARVTLTDVNDKHALFQLCDKYDIDFEEWMLDELPILIERSVDLMRKTTKIDFTDMIFMPVHLNMDCAKYGWVLVDEAQDLSNCQREVVLKHLEPGGRFVAVGDPFQSIYGFSGANPASYALIQSQTNAKELPLSVCYRCPTSHIELAQKVVPHIEAAPGAADGTVLYERESKIDVLTRPGDLILCRNTAPLIKNCIKLVKSGIRSNVRGRNIGAGLVSIIKKIDSKKGYGTNFRTDFPKDLDRYSDKEVEKLMARDASESVIETFQDKIICIMIVFDEFGSTDAGHLIDMIDDLFSDTPSTIYFSSIHRAKGLENDRVMILNPHKMALVWKDQSEEEWQQEQNAKYVGLTRGKKELVFLEAEV